MRCSFQSLATTNGYCEKSVKVGTRLFPQGLPPGRVRRIRYRDSQGRPYVFLTDHMTLPVNTICDLYRLRWQVDSSSNGSNSTCASNAFSAPLTMPSEPRSG